MNFLRRKLNMARGKGSSDDHRASIITTKIILDLITKWLILTRRGHQAREDKEQEICGANVAQACYME
jgi:hypothetical protein